MAIQRQEPRESEEPQKTDRSQLAWEPDSKMGAIACVPKVFEESLEEGGDDVLPDRLRNRPWKHVPKDVMEQVAAGLGDRNPPERQAGRRQHRRASNLFVARDRFDKRLP